MNVQIKDNQRRKEDKIMIQWLIYQFNLKLYKSMKCIIEERKDKIINEI